MRHAKASSSVSTAWSTAPQRVWISQPPSSCLLRFSPRRATTGGPATNMRRRPWSSPNSGSRRGAPHRAPRPSRGRAPPPEPPTGCRSSGRSLRSLPTPPGRLARPVVSMVLTEPPPPEPSMMRTIGEPELLGHALRHDGLLLDGGVRRAAAHREVVAGHHDGAAVDDWRGRRRNWRASGRPGRRCRRRSPCRRWRRFRESVPASTRRSMRSRTVRRPPSCWRLTLSGPPMASAMRVRRSSSSSCASQAMGFSSQRQSVVPSRGAWRRPEVPATGVSC